MLRLLLAALLALVGRAAAQPAVGQPLTPDNIYSVDDGVGETVLAPGVAWGDHDLTQVVQLREPSALDCAKACRNITSCDWWDYTACYSDQNDTFCEACHLFRSNCTLAPLVGSGHDEPQGAQLTAGFPIRHTLPDAPGFQAEAGKGVAGFDMTCPQTLVPGKCALASPVDALITCSLDPKCQGVVHYFNGTDGCSAEVSLLVSGDLTPENSFVAPSVTTWMKTTPTDGSQSATEASALTTQDGIVLLPSEEEQAALDEAASAGGQPNATAWLGCIVSQQALMAGDVVATLDGTASAEECCRACRADEACNVWNFCAQQAGCSYKVGVVNTTLSAGQCQLRFNEFADQYNGFPPAVMAKGRGVPFSGGAPLAVWAPQLPGYSQLPAHLPYKAGNWNCSFSLRPLLEECVISRSTAEEVAATCSAYPECAGFDLKPGWVGQPFLAVLKQSINASSVMGLSATSFLLLRDTPAPAPQEAAGGGGGLSAGAIAGVAVAAAAAAAALAFGAWLLLRGRRRQRTAQSAPAAHGGSADNSGKLDTADAGLSASGPGVDGGGGPDSAAPSAGGSAPPSAGASGPSSGNAGAPRSGGTADSGNSRRSVAISPFAAARASIDGVPSAAAPASIDCGPLAAARASAASGPFAAARASVDGGPFAAARAGADPGALGGYGAFGTSAAPYVRASLDMPPGAAPAAPPAAPGRAGMASPFAAARMRAASSVAASGAASPVGSGVPSAGPSGAALPSAGPSGAFAAASTPRISTTGAAGAWPACDPAAAASSPPSAGSDRNMLPELAAHIAEVDAGVAWPGDSGSGAGDGEGGDLLLSERSLLAPHRLPASLRDWVVDAADVELQRWPGGALKELGSGASGTVYKATFRGETVAAKEVDLGRSASVQELFVTEAERLHQLRHAHVVALYGIALSGARGLLIMEYCSGRDLHSVLQLKKAGTQRRLFGWYGRGATVALEVAKALNFLEAKGVVHLDVKSSNVLLTGAGSAKLADVGVARLREGTYLSAMGQAVGTFAWMAPEVLTNQRCTAAVDIYSFGVVLWEIVTGLRPTRGDMRLPAVPDECPQEVADLILACMALDPAARPTAKQLMLQLEELAGRRSR